MDTYLTAWKTFRRLSDENRATARCLVTQPLWPPRDGVVIVDIGCGDGRLVEEVVLQSPSKIDEVRLIDPDAELLAEAAACVGELALVRRIDAIHSAVENLHSESMLNANVLLCVHVVYLLAPVSLNHTLELLPSGVPLYIVLDSPGSVFTALWERTAPRYHRRAVEAHQIIRGLSNRDYTIKTTTVQSTVCNPITVARPDVRDALLSILCYREISNGTDNDLRDWIAKTLTERAAGNGIRCESTCYEITRPG